MRHYTAATSILVIGAIAAACGGDAGGGAPEPTDGATTDGATTAPAATAAGADTGEASDTGAAPSAAAFLKTAQATSADDPAATHPLIAGRYRMGWTTDDCEQVDILVSQVDGEFTYPKPSRSSIATAIINDLPEGHFTIEQLDPACTEWQVRVDWMTD